MSEVGERAGTMALKESAYRVIRMTLAEIRTV